MIALVVMAVQAQSICLQIVPKKHLYLMKTGGEVGMKLYRKYIRPMHCYPGQHYEPKTELVEKEEKWYPEEERENLEEKYGYLNEGHFSDLIFEEKYEPYIPKEQEAVKPKSKVSHGANAQIQHFCGSCMTMLHGKPKFCSECGKPVLWEGR